MSIISSGVWLTAKRVQLYPTMFLTISAVLSVAYLLSGHSNLDVRGKPIGTDFASFWAASRFVLSGNAGDAYDPIKHYAAQEAFFGKGVVWAAWFYPPPALLIIAPLGILPYLISLFTWLAATGVVYIATVRRFISRPDSIVPVLCFPAVLINIIHGQNAFLSTSIVGTGLLMSDRYPTAAGMLLGTLCFKPQLAPMLAVVVFARGNWRMALGAAFSVCAIATAATQLFGPEIWRQFWSTVPLSRLWLEEGLTGFAKMQSAFSAVRLIGGGINLAYSIQAAFSISAAILLWMIWRSVASIRLRAGATGAAILLGTPFILDYDFVLLSLPIAALAAEGLEDGFRPYEKTILACAWTLPLIARLAGFAYVPLSPEIVMFLLVLIWRRATLPHRSSLAAAGKCEVPAVD
ncbi:glycosyltransferase family 87 protein [Bradyrhizobium brasilense]|uniref:Glycosyltransferase family 87 protein n=1 Tax=Bradyrhizobium brasilense TaxID=1419277 RepID=A0ABY8J7F9_9BRAD|nr:glycosyltransferase family 87 protein [Bradyrhizobium brasilense]WFU61431.1 glycosyltransferase family 87 protein [Bradyrhizobium brasilense]